MNRRIIHNLLVVGTILLVGIAAAAGFAAAAPAPSASSLDERSPKPAVLVAAASSARDPFTAKAPSRAASPSLVLPSPTGHSAVGTFSLRWVDPARPDPFLPGRRRELMVQLWYPAAGTAGLPLAEYLPAGTARAYERLGGIGTPVFDRIRVHARNGAAALRARYPVLLFSPGFGVAKGFYTALLEELASQGFIVLGIDHPYDAAVVEFPDGRLVPARFGNGPAPNRALTTRVADAHFVLDRLPRLNAHGRLAGRLDLKRIGMFGNSLGGAAVAELMLRDRRVSAGADLDGSFHQHAERRGVRGPFLLMTAPRGVGPSERAYRAHLRRSQLRLTLRGADHYTFSDFAVTLPALERLAPALRRELPVGSIDGQRALTIERRYLAAFFRAHLKGTPEPLLTRPSGAYPEVGFERGTH